MASPAKSASHPGRALAVLGGLILIMILGILGSDLGNPAHWHKDFKVALGLDLSSGTEVSMLATTPSGGTPSSSEMSTAVSIITSRVNGTGNSGASVQTQGSNIITVSIPGKTGPQVVQLVSQTALLRFREVLLYQSPVANASTTPTSSPTASASPSASASASSSPHATSSPSASATSTAKTSAKIVSSSPSPSAGASASPHSSSSASASPSASSSASPSPSASSSTSSSAVGDASKVQPAVLKLFNKLTCKAGESDSEWKDQVGYTKSSDWDTKSQQVVSCNTSTGEKYALDVAKVDGIDVTGAQAALSTTSNQWQVNLTFNGKGSADFGNLTTELYNSYYSTAQSQQGGSDYYLDQVAIVLDGDVVSAPEIQGAITGGNAQITGSFTQQQANQLANVLKYGSLPLSLNVQSQQSVSPTLGHNQLDAGLVAGAVGLVLVVLYSFIYYRGLGLISISSLMIAALLGYLTIVLLSKGGTFTLSLAGIAGLIVAIGITADSFVVFFERLRDEVREGKQLRPAVEAGWKRARRTILVSDTVSFLAALLLYYFAISDVKGFAYTLGLTTLIDIIVVFLFTHPMVTIVARTKFYGNGHPLSGLDPKRLGARAPWRSSVRVARSRTGARTSARNSGEA